MRTPSLNCIAGPSRLRLAIPLSRRAIHSGPIITASASPPPYAYSGRRYLSTSTPRSTPLDSSPTGSKPGFTTINDSEISHFSRLASEWWSETGEFALLHRMNPARIEYIRQQVAFDPRIEEPWTFEGRAGDWDRENSKGTGRWLAGKRVLDVGCGGGLLSEALARLGADVIGVDASGVNIGMALAHAKGDLGLPLVDQSVEGSIGGQAGAKGERVGAGKRSGGGGKGSLEYRHTSAEALRDAGEKFDVVCAMEVVEHVDEPGEFMKALGDMVKPGGHLIMSTISRTPFSRLLTLTMAEDVLRLVTPGTHTYSKFIKPEEIRRFVWREMGGYDVWEKEEDAADVRKGEVGRTRGIVYDPIKATWKLWGGVEGSWMKGLGEGCNYMFGARKRF